MEAALKRKQVRVYLDAEAEKHLNAITNGVRRLSESAIVTELVAAALEACANAGRLNLPVKFHLVEPSNSQLNEPSNRYKK